MPGLVLTGGGARAAYQAGVLLGISEVLGRDAPSPFPILTGVSAGAINGSFLASQASNNWHEAVTALSELWRNLSFDQIFRTNTSSLMGLSTRWVRDLGLGAMFSTPRSTHLLDSSPLQKLLFEQVDFETIASNLAAGKLHGVGISVTSYKTGTAITYYDGNSSIRPWSRTSRLGMRDTLTLEHVLASASIPLFFKPVRIGNAFYGDGGVRLSSPLSPAIHLGSSRILAISVRYSRPIEQTRLLNENPDMPQIAISDIAGVLLNALFLDALESDVERLERINQTQALLTEEQRSRMREPLRQIPILTIYPSRDLGTFAADQIHRFPGMLRYLLKGLGVGEEKGSDLLSYLAFDRSYTEKLVDLGRADAIQQGAQIRAFLDPAA
jgi:NTE family protein